MSAEVAAWGLAIKMAINFLCAGMYVTELKWPQALIFMGLVVADAGMVILLWRAH